MSISSIRNYILEMAPPNLRGLDEFVFKIFVSIFKQLIKVENRETKTISQIIAEKIRKVHVIKTDTGKEIYVIGNITKDLKGKFRKIIPDKYKGFNYFLSLSYEDEYSGATIYPIEEDKIILFEFKIGENIPLTNKYLNEWLREVHAYIIHEVTHMVDIPTTKYDPMYPRGEFATRDKIKYYTHPSEAIAYSQNIIQELIENKKRNPSLIYNRKTILNYIRMTEWFQEIQKVIPEKDVATIKSIIDNVIDGIIYHGYYDDTRTLGHSVRELFRPAYQDIKLWWHRLGKPSVA